MDYWKECILELLNRYIETDFLEDKESYLNTARLYFGYFEEDLENLKSQKI